MSVISAALDDVFGEPDLAIAALWRSRGAGAGRAVQIMRSAPDDVLRLGSTNVVAGTNVFFVRRSEIATVERDDTFAIGVEVFRVIGTPSFPDDRQLIWRCEAVKEV